MISYTVCNLYSGSKGNSTYINVGGVKILIDAGKSARAIKKSLESQNVDIDDIDAIFITHEHRDHIAALQNLTHKHKIPIYICYASARCFQGLRDEALCECLNIQKARDFCINIRGVEIKAFPTPHDSLCSVGYRITYSDGEETLSIGYATDVGVVTDVIKDNLTGCRVIVLESNHDKKMLRYGDYPPELKRRIASNFGHLSNRQAADFASYLCENGTDSIILAHLSEENNTPDTAYGEVYSAVADDSVRILVANQTSPTLLTDTYPETQKETFGWLKSN